jgi:hypothetical protein
MKKTNKILTILGCTALGLAGIGISKLALNKTIQTDALSEAVFSTCGFETGESFTAGTSYQGSTAITGGATGKQWDIIGGNFSTSSAISGSQSAAMRLYSSSTFYSSLTTKFAITDMTKFTFNAKAATSNGASILVNVDYSLDNSTWLSMYKVQSSQTATDKWSASALTSSAVLYTAYLPSDLSISGVADPYIRISIASSSTKPSSSNAQLTVDDFTFYGMTSADNVALASSTAKVLVGGTTSINVSAASGDVTWSSSNTSIATVSGTNSAVTIAGVAVGTATITAAVGSAKATLTVTVVAAPTHAGTASDPYSVSDAIKVIDFNLATAATSYYVSALYISTTTAWNSSYTNITIVLKDSTSDTNSLTAYRMAAVVEPTLVANTTTVALSVLGSNFSLYGGKYEASNGTYIDPDNAVLNTFVTNYMHTDVAYTEAGTGACASSGWYSSAKAAFNALTARQRSLFVADTANYANPYKRLTAWAAANGETISTTDNTLGSNIIASDDKKDASNVYVYIAAGIAVFAVAAFFYFRKKKQA